MNFTPRIGSRRRASARHHKVLSPYYQFSKLFYRLPRGACLRPPSRLLCQTGYEGVAPVLASKGQGGLVLPGKTNMLIEKLNWRYATKKMDPSKTVKEDKVERIVEAARLAPTSSGLQPFEVIVVTDPEVRAKIREIAWNQAQVTEGSHLLVFAAWDNYTEERINHMFDLVNEERGIRNEGWESYRQMLLSSYPQRDEQVNFDMPPARPILVSAWRWRRPLSRASIPPRWKVSIRQSWMKSLAFVKRACAPSPSCRSDIASRKATGW